MYTIVFVSYVLSVDSLNSIVTMFVCVLYFRKEYYVKQKNNVQIILESSFAENFNKIGFGRFDLIF